MFLGNLYLLMMTFIYLFTRFKPVETTVEKENELQLKRKKDLEENTSLDIIQQSRSVSFITH